MRLDLLDNRLGLQAVPGSRGVGVLHLNRLGLISDDRVRGRKQPLLCNRGYGTNRQAVYGVSRALQLCQDPRTNRRSLLNTQSSGT